MGAECRWRKAERGRSAWCWVGGTAPCSAACEGFGGRMGKALLLICRRRNCDLHMEGARPSWLKMGLKKAMKAN